jgi:hypothetical protein
MNINEIDKFRNDFFDKLIKEEREKAAAIERQQANCVHKYDKHGRPTAADGYQSRICSKCGHHAIKSLRVWRGTENGGCTIS